VSSHFQNTPAEWNGSVKRCLDCGDVKSLDEFPPSKRRLDGRGSYCRPCYGTRSRASYRKRQAEQGRTVSERRVAPDGQKWCNDCQTFKPLDEFGRNKNTKTGRASYCKDCHNKRSQDTRRLLYGGGREYHLRRRYGLGQVDIDQILAGQNGTCAVCGRPDPGHVDHDHKSGRVRGMLCFNCNQALGNVRDNLQVIYGLATYLRTSRHPSGEGHYFSAVEVALESVHRRPA
jgi:hypothetical protein